MKNETSEIILELQNGVLSNMLPLVYTGLLPGCGNGRQPDRGIGVRYRVLSAFHLSFGCGFQVKKDFFGASLYVGCCVLYVSGLNHYILFPSGQVQDCEPAGFSAYSSL